MLFGQVSLAEFHEVGWNLCIVHFSSMAFYRTEMKMLRRGFVTDFRQHYCHESSTSNVHDLCIVATLCIISTIGSILVSVVSRSR